MRIGIYLGYAPYIKPMSLKQEGLGRYLAFLVKGFTQTNHQLIIACPNWVVPLVEELFTGEDIDTTNLEFLTSTAEPVLYRAYVKWINREQKQRVKKNRLRKSVINWKDSLLELFLKMKNAVLSIIALPFAILGGLLYAFMRLLWAVFRKVFRINITKAMIQQLLARSSIYRSVRERWDAPTIQEKIRRYSAEEIIKKAKGMKNPPDVWYSPTAFWNEFNSFPGVRVVCVPDWVTMEFPSKFSQGSFYDATKRISDTIKEGQYFVTYCDYLRDSLLMAKFHKNKNNIAVITHAQNDMLPFLNLENYFKRVPFKEDVNRYFAQNIVMPYILAHSVNMGSYLLQLDRTNNFSFSDVDYIFYPSQVRENKNIRNLVKAYEYLLRTRNIRIKLILTCNLNNDKKLCNYIYENRLQYDVLSFNSVTAQQLAALYMCAKLVVNPTLYEGGFPFTFGEGMSVGTPSVMSNIPQVREVLKDGNLSEYIFDPYDYIDMAKKIEKGLQNREELFEKEKAIYSKLSGRTWENVCEEYIQAFQYFINRSKNENVV